MTTTPGVMKSFLDKITATSIEDSELNQLVNALRFIQFDRTLVATDATGNITGDMITKIEEITDLGLNSGTFDATTTTAANQAATAATAATATAAAAAATAAAAAATADDKTASTAAAAAAATAVAAVKDITNRNGYYQFHYIEYTDDATKGYEYVTLDVEIINGVYTLTKNTQKETATSVSTDKKGILSTKYKNVHNFLVKEKLKQYLKDDLFQLFSKPVKDIDELSDPKDPKAFKHFNEGNRLYDKSLIDIILELEHYINESTVTAVEQTTNKNKYDLFKSIYDFMNNTSGVVTDSDPENSLIMDIVAFKDSIDESKQKIKDKRNKIYTYLSRDENYTKTLKTKRIMLYLSIAAFIVVSVFYGGILYTNSMTNPEKSTIVLVAASLILFTNMVLYIMRFNYQSRETFQASTEIFVTNTIYGFTAVAGDTSQADIAVPEIMKELCIRYVNILSKEIKNEYYDALYVSQKKDKELLEKLEKEHNIKSHFHQLKNNLSHFKINETKEYSKLSQLAIVLISLVAILYLTVLQDTIDMEIFNIVSGLTFIIFVTYVLLTVKSIMLRDKYDWDRFNWTVKNLNSNIKSEQCPLPGFPN